MTPTTSFETARWALTIAASRTMVSGALSEISEHVVQQKACLTMRACGMISLRLGYQRDFRTFGKRL